MRPARLQRQTQRTLPGAKCGASLAWLIITACVPPVAQAQLSPGTLRQINNDLANDAVSAVGVFSAANTIATGDFHYNNPGSDDVDFQTYKLPYSHSFKPTTNAVHLFVEGHLGYFDLQQTVTSFGSPPGEIQVQSISAAAGGGATWQITDWLAASPRLLFAYSHATHHFDRDAQPGDPFADALPDWRLDALTMLPSLEINATRSRGSWDFALNSRYTYLHAVGLADTSNYINLNSESHVWRSEVAVSYRSPWRVHDLALRPFGLFARHDLAGQIRHSNFVEHFYEARVGLGLTTPAFLKPLREVSASFAYYFEGDFTGYSFGLNVAF